LYSLIFLYRVRSEIPIPVLPATAAFIFSSAFLISSTSLSSRRETFCYLFVLVNLCIIILTWLLNCNVGVSVVLTGILLLCSCIKFGVLCKYCLAAGTETFSCKTVFCRAHQIYTGDNSNMLLILQIRQHYNSTTRSI